MGRRCSFSLSSVGNGCIQPGPNRRPSTNHSGKRKRADEGSFRWRPVVGLGAAPLLKTITLHVFSINPFEADAVKMNRLTVRHRRNTAWPAMTTQTTAIKDTNHENAENMQQKKKQILAHADRCAPTKASRNAAL